MATLAARHLELPDERDTELAKDAAGRLAELLREASPSSAPFLLGNGDAADGPASVPLPTGALRHLAEVLTEMGRGNAVAVIPVRPEIYTWEAAEILNVDHSYMISLLDEGEIPCRRVNGFRRVPLPELLEFKRRDHERTQKLLNEMARESQLMGLYEL